MLPLLVSLSIPKGYECECRFALMIDVQTRMSMGTRASEGQRKGMREKKEEERRKKKEKNSHRSSKLLLLLL